MDRQGTDERATKRRRDRNVSLIPQDDAMSTLLAQLPCEVASAIYASLDQAAPAAAARAQSTRTALRSDNPIATSRCEE